MRRSEETEVLNRIPFGRNTRVFQQCHAEWLHLGKLTRRRGHNTVLFNPGQDLTGGMAHEHDGDDDGDFLLTTGPGWTVPAMPLNPFEVGWLFTMRLPTDYLNKCSAFHQM